MTKVSHYIYYIICRPSKWNGIRFMNFLQFLLGGLKKTFFYPCETMIILKCFRLENIIFYLDSLMVKYGSEKKIMAKIFGFSYAFLTFSCILKFERQLSEEKQIHCYSFWYTCLKCPSLSEQMKPFLGLSHLDLKLFFYISTIQVSE